MPERGRLTEQQVAQLLTAPDRRRLGSLQGKSHLKAWDVRRWLIRVFGHGNWDDRILDSALVAEWETDEDRPVYDDNGQRTGQTKRVHYWQAIYRVTLALDVRSLDGLPVCTYEDVATCDAKGPSRGDVHDQALKGAASQALKRCAVNLGDLFGLSLYNGGSLDPVVVRTLAMGQPPPTQADDGPVRDDHDPTVDATEQDQAPTSTVLAPTSTVLDRMTPEQRQQATGQQPAGQPAPPLDDGVVGGRPKGRTAQQLKDEAAVVLGAAEAAAGRGDVARVRNLWEQAQRDSLLDAPVDDQGQLSNLRAALTRFGEAATQSRVGQSAPAFGEWTGAQPSSVQ